MSASPFLDEALPTPAPADARWVWAVVTQTSPLRIRLDGDRTPLAITPDDMGSVPRSVGQRVYCQILNRRLVVIGPVVLGGAMLAPDTDLNDLKTSGTWEASDASLANTLKNWPIPAIPSTATADGQNPLASYRSAVAGVLRVTRSGARVVQEVETFSNPGTPVMMTHKRMLTATNIWTAWVLQNNPVAAQSAAEQANIGLFHTVPTRANPLEVLRTDFAVGYKVQTVDGVRWTRESSGQVETAHAWGNQTLLGTWTAYGSGYITAQAVRTSLGIIMLRGLVKDGSGFICKLPPGYRPSAKLMFLTMDSGSFAGGRIDITPDGVVNFVGNTSNSSAWVSLDKIQFPAADVAPNSAWTPITFANGFSSHSALDPSWPVCSWWQDPLGQVWFRGLGRRAAGDPTSDAMFGSIPLSLAPSNAPHMPMCASGATNFASAHIDNDGAQTRLVWKSGGSAGNSGFFSLSDLRLHPKNRFPDAQWRGLGLGGGWVQYEGLTPVSVWVREDGIVLVRGLIRSGLATYAISIGAGDRPIPVPSIFCQSANNAPARVNYGHEAASLVAATGSNVWLSIDGMCWFNER